MSGAAKRKPGVISPVGLIELTLGAQHAIGHEQGVRDERARILAALSALERDALPPLCVEGTAAARAVAAFVAKVRAVVEGKA